MTRSYRSKHGYCAAALLALSPLVACTVATAAPARESQPTGSALATACEGRDGWSDAAPPAPIFGNTYYVGTCGISVILITDRKGHVLIDGATAQAAPGVIANIRRLGFDPRDVRWIVSSHEHNDHVGGLAALQQATGAKVAAIAEAKPWLEAGRMADNDPQRSIGEPFAPVRVERVLADGETLRVGQIALAVHATPAHSPGSASWTWQSCTGGRRPVCQTMTYADSATVISGDDYRFSNHPDRIAQALRGLQTIGALPCGVLMTPHPGASNLFARLAGTAPLADPSACQTYAAKAGAAFAQRLAEEKTTPLPATMPTPPIGPAPEAAPEAASSDGSVRP